MTGNCLIQGGRLIDPLQGTDAIRDLRIRDGRILTIAERLAPEPMERTVDARGLVVAPAFADIHVHFREPGGEVSETVASGSEAAARGGFGRVWCMPNTSPTIDSTLVVKYIRDRAAEHARLGKIGSGVGVHPVACISRGMKSEEMTEFSALWDAGAGAFSDDGLPVAHAGMMRRAMQAIVDLPPNEHGGRPVIFDHCEDMSLTGPGVMHEGRVSADLGYAGIPRSSEAVGIARDCALSLETGCRLHICHVSTRDSVEVIRYFKGRGAPVSAEVSPHHLIFTDERVRGADGSGLGDTHAKMKPPLCDEIDRSVLVEALLDGTIDCIATDHAPHAPQFKSKSFEDAPFGIIGLETAFCSLHTRFVATGEWSISFLIEKMASAPAQVLGWNSFGSLRVGGGADLVLLDPSCEWVFSESDLGSRSRNCPWLGERMMGRVIATLLSGQPSFVLEGYSDRGIG